MDCRGVKRELCAFADGVLASKEQQAIKSHLETCLACQDELRQLRQVWNLLDEFEPVASPPDFIERLWRRIKTGKTRFMPYAWPVPRRLIRWAALVASAAVLLIVIITLSVIKPPSDSLPSSEKDLVQHLDLIENMEIVEMMDLIEHSETIDHLSEIMGIASANHKEDIRK